MDETNIVIQQSENLKNLELICGSISNIFRNSPTILWFKNKQLIQNKKNKYQISGHCGLIISNLNQEEDNGRYSCQSQINDQTISTYFHLELRAPLKFTVRPLPIISRQVNEEIMLECKTNNNNISNNQQPAIIWRKNAELINNNQYFQINDGILRIKRFLDSDEGVFQCFAEDEFESIQVSTQLNIKRSYIPQSSNENNLARPVTNLRVRTAGYKTLNITWNHPTEGFDNILNYEIVLMDLSGLCPPSLNTIRMKVNKIDSSVLVRNLIPDSFYEISVYSVNAHGPGLQTFIHSSPRVLSRPPNTAPTHIKVTEIGSTVTTVSWLAPDRNQLNGQLIGYRLSVGTTDSLFTRAIQISVTQESTDKIAQGSSTSHQMTDLLPNTQYQVQVQAATRGGHGPTSTAVVFNTAAVPNQFDPNITASRGSQDFPSLDYGLTDDDSVALHSPVDSRLKSRGDSKPTKAPGEVTKYKVVSHNTSLTISWSHPIDGGRPDKYMVFYGYLYPGTNKEIVEYPTNSVTLTHLRPQTNYMIKMVAVNAAGESKKRLFSERTVERKVEKIPIPLTLNVDKIGQNWVILSWEDPSNEGSSTRIYQINCTLHKKKSIQQAPIVKNSTTTTIQIDGLLLAAEYTFAVRTGDFSSGDYSGDNGGGSSGSTYQWTWSDWSLKETFVTLGKKPSVAPGNIQISLVGEPRIQQSNGDQVFTDIKLTWTNPIEAAGGDVDQSDPLSSYVVYFTGHTRAHNNIKKWSIQQLSAAQHSTHISLSGADTFYFFRIGCRTKNFECPLSRNIVFKTPNAQGKNYGVIKLPKKYHYSNVIPGYVLTSAPLVQSNSDTPSSATNSKQENDGGDAGWSSKFNQWIIPSVLIGSAIFLVTIAAIIVYACCKLRNHNRSNMLSNNNTNSLGYKSGTKLSYNQDGTVRSGLLMSNNNGTNNSNHASPLVNGKMSPHYNIQLKTPDIMSFPTTTNYSMGGGGGGGGGEMDSNASSSGAGGNPHDNGDDSLRFTSVSQHHLGPSPSNTTQYQQHYPYHYGTGSPLHNTLTHPSVANISSQQHPTMMLQHPTDVVPPLNFANTPRVNASELASTTSSEEAMGKMLSSQCHNNVYFNEYMSNPYTLPPSEGDPHEYSPILDAYEAEHLLTTGSYYHPDDMSYLYNNPSQQQNHHPPFKSTTAGVPPPKSSTTTTSSIMSSGGTAIHPAPGYTSSGLTSLTAPPSTLSGSSGGGGAGFITSTPINYHHQHQQQHPPSQPQHNTEKAFSTEELSQEMANLEGLMKDLNAITQKEFEC